MKIWNIIFFYLLLRLSYQKNNHQKPLARKLPNSQLSMQMLNQLINVLQGGNNQSYQNPQTFQQQPTPQQIQIQQVIAQQRLHQVNHQPLTNQTQIQNQLQHQQMVQAQVVHQPVQNLNKNRLSEKDFFSNEDLQNMNHGFQPTKVNNLQNVINSNVQQPQNNLANHKIIQHHVQAQQKLAQHHVVVAHKPNAVDQQHQKDKKEIQHLNHQIHRLETQIKSKDENIEKLQQELQQQKYKFQDQESGFKKNELEVSRLNEEIKQLNEQKQKLIEEHFNKETELQKKLDEIQKKNEQDIQEIQKLQDQLIEQKQKLEDEQTTQDDLENQLEKVKQERDSDTQGIQDYASEVADLKDKINQLEEEKKAIEETTNNMQQIAEKAVQTVYDQKLQDYKDQTKQQLDNIVQHLDVFNSLDPQENQNKERTKQFVTKIDDLIQQSEKDIKDTQLHLPEEHPILPEASQDLDGDPEDQIDIGKIDSLMAKLEDPEVDASDYQHQEDNEHHLPADQMEHVEKQIEQLTEMLGNLDDNRKERVLFQKLPQRNLQVQPRMIIQNFKIPKEQNQKTERKMVLNKSQKKQKIQQKNRKLRKIRNVKYIYDRHHRLLKKIPLEKFHYAKQYNKGDDKQLRSYKRIINEFKKDKIKYIQII